MLIRKAYKFRLKPNAVQQQHLYTIAGHCRFLWNKVLHMNLTRLDKKQSIFWYQEADFWSKRWKASEEYGFLKEVPAHCIQQKLKDLDKAFRDAFDKTQPFKRLPRYKKRGMGDSFRFPEPKQIQLDNRRIKLPKLGWICFYKSQAIKGSIKNVTVSRRSGQWYISIQVEQEIPTPIHPEQSMIGVDMGIAKFAAYSDGRFKESIHVYRTWEQRLARAQRHLARKKKFSENWKKQQRAIQKLHGKIANVRRDFLHKTSTQLSKSHAMIVVEDLKISKMSRSAKGSLEQPGRQVKAKSGLNKSILDQGWGEFCRQLEYKLCWLGGMLLKVKPQYTSQMCSVCGFVDACNRITRDNFVCQSCGFQADADSNAARNILAAGHAVLACGEDALATSKKQELLGIGNLVPA